MATKLITRRVEKTGLPSLSLNQPFER